jgi:hypothetical protein
MKLAAAWLAMRLDFMGIIILVGCGGWLACCKRADFV